MTKDEFLREADRIADEPLSRAPRAVTKIKDDRDVVYETHIHLFGKEAVADWYLLLRILEGINPDGWFLRLADTIYDKTKDNQLDETLEILNAGGPAEVLKRYLKRRETKKYIYVPLMMDLRNWVDRELDAKPLPRQVDDLLALVKTEPVLPFFSVDPRRADLSGEDNLYSLFVRAFRSTPGFFGIKLYPALGFLPADPRLLPIYEVCEAKHIPVAVHCGSTMIRSFQPNLRVSGELWRNGRIREWDNHLLRQRLFGRRMRVGGGKVNRRAEFLNDPRHWRPVLKRFPNLKLNLAHLGGGDHWNQFLSTGRDQRLTHIHQLMEEYSRVYADISGMHLAPDHLRRFVQSVQSSEFPRFRDRCMFGTDFWVTLPFGDYVTLLNEYDRIVPDPLRGVLDRDNPKEYLFG